MNMKRLKDILLFSLQVVSVLAHGTRQQKQKNATPSHQGKSFLLGFLEMENYSGRSAIYVTCATNAQINITIPQLNRTITRYATPGVSTRVDLSTAVRMRGMARENKGILLTANVTVSVYATNARKTSRDVYVNFPTPTLGTQHVVATYTPTNKSLVGVIALHDNTLVQIKLRLEGNITYMGKKYNNGNILRIFLNRLETFQLQYTKDLTGTFVVSSEPVVVLVGNICAMVPTPIYECSHLVTQLVPVSKWGTQFITSPIAGRQEQRQAPNYFRIVAGYDDTFVSIRGKSHFTLHSGEFSEFSLSKTESRYIVANNSVLLMQYNKGSDPYIQWGPFALTVPPIEQYTNEYYLPIGVEKLSPPFINHVTIVVKSSDVRYVLFNSSTYCASNSTVAHDTNYTIISCQLLNFDVSTVIPIRHASKGGRFTAFMVGHTDKDGFGYLGGMEMRDVNCRKLFPQRTVIGDTVDNDCDGRIDEEIENGVDDDNDELIDEDTGSIASCDIKLTMDQKSLPSSEYLNGSHVKDTINYINSHFSPTNHNCEARITRTWSFTTPSGVRIIAARQEIGWRKQKPIIILPTETCYNLSVSEVRAKSTLCPRDRLRFNDSASVTKNGSKIVQRTWVVQEECGRVTTIQQTILADSSDDVNRRTYETSFTFVLILGTALGIPIIILAMAICIFIARKRHVSRRVTMSVRIDVKEAKKDVYHVTNQAATIEDCLYSQINKDLNENSSKQQSKAISFEK